ACQWIKNKFGIDINSDEVVDLEPAQFIEHVRGKVAEKYREKEYKFPVLAGLIHFTVHDQNGKRYDRKSIVEWAANRFDTDLSYDDLKNMQRHEIEEKLFEISRQYSERATDYYDEMKKQLYAIFRTQNIDIEKICRFRDQKIARNEKISPDEQIHLDGRQEQVSELCQWLHDNFNTSVTPADLGDWDITLIENRLESIIENRFNPEMRNVERSLILGILDASWKEHLLVMDHLKASVSFRGYAQVDPKVEYKREGMKVFEAMWDGIFERVTDYVYRVEQLDERFIGSTWTEAEASHHSMSGTSAVNAAAQEIQNQQEAAIEATKSHKVETIRNKKPRIGRNEPCPCGSGKKYKNCCGKLQ
ncbi:MAG: SEC-C domain-containing protein, partial [Thermoguttaceae bacterium]|nr:SEC-C domain-containing protein [Thermoguttaceae bacterium]